MKVKRAVQGKRLVYYREKADSPDFWNRHWDDDFDMSAVVGGARRDKNLLPTFLQYLPKQGKILEGGCGLGQWVIVLRERGYDVKGVDFAKETIEQTRKCFPNLPVEEGNVFRLDYPDGYLAGYISLGVVEHFEEGPEKTLEEAHRVLGDGGVLLISVPYFNPIRRMKTLYGLYSDVVKEGEFYQYAFTVAEFKHILRKTGFSVVDVVPYDAVKGLKDEIALMRMLHHRLSGQARAADMQKQEIVIDTNIDGRGLLKTILYSYPTRWLAAHMVMFVARAV